MINPLQTTEQMNYELKGTKVMSYGTHVATVSHKAKTVRAHGKWSATTTRHVNKLAQELGYTVTQDKKGQAASKQVSGQTFGAQRIGIVKEDHEQSDDQGAGMLAVLKMFGALAQMSSRTPEEATRAKADLLKRTPGIQMPDDWDSLSSEEQKRRTDKAFQVL